MFSKIDNGQLGFSLIFFTPGEPKKLNSRDPLPLSFQQNSFALPEYCDGTDGNCVNGSYNGVEGSDDKDCGSVAGSGDREHDGEAGNVDCDGSNNCDRYIWVSTIGEINVNG